MTTYAFPDMVGTTVAAFDPATDSLTFAAGMSAADIVVSAVDGDTLIAVGADAVRLAGVAPSSLGGTQFVFADGSLYRRGAVDADADRLVGSMGNDWLQGGDGSNTLEGGSGHDRLEGGAGDDVLDGSYGRDTLSGGAGNDTLYGGTTGDGNGDSLLGGEGADLFVLHGSSTIIESYISRTEAPIRIADFDAGEGDRISAYLTAPLPGNGLLWRGQAAPEFKANLGDAMSLAGAAAFDPRFIDELWTFTDGGDTVLFADRNINGIVDADDLRIVFEGIVALDPGSFVAGTFVGTYGTEGDDSDTEPGLSTAGDLALGLGGNDSLDGLAGDDTLRGDAGDDLLAGGAGHDQVFGGTGDDLLEGGDDDDAVYGGDGVDTLRGGSGRDTLHGDGGSDVLEGGDGNDELRALGAGAATMSGGAGADLFVFQDRTAWPNSILDSSSSTVAAPRILTDFDPAEGDRIYGGTGSPWANGVAWRGVADAAFTASLGQSVELAGGAPASSEAPEFWVATEGGDTILFMDLNRNAVVDAGDFKLVFTGAVALSKDSFAAGSLRLGLGEPVTSSLADLVFGHTGDDTIYGLEGDDYLDGEDGNDHLDGGEGADYLLGSAGNDLLDGGSDADHLDGRDGNDRLYGGDGLDRLEGGEGADRLYGGDGNDELVEVSGNNTLDGGAGADTMRGGVGDDVYVVDHADDVVAETYLKLGVDRVESHVAVYVLPAGVEHGSIALASASRLTGNMHANRLAGGSSEDTLAGDGGADTLDGGGGADSLVGGSGDDTYYVDAIGDTIAGESSVSSGGIDTVITSIDWAATGMYVENLRAASGTASVDLTGNTLANILTGNDGKNILDGWKGADVMRGGKGNDTYHVDNRDDDVAGESGSASGGIDTVITSIDWAATGRYVENLKAASGTASIDLTGNTLANTLTGNDGRNILDGWKGADVMRGGKGDDTYHVDNVGDNIDGESRAGGGFDSVFANISWSLTGDYVENLTLTGSGGINGTGNKLANVIIGNAGRNALQGGAGADSLTGGSGSDRFVYASASESTARNLDRITDFTRGSDKIDLSHLDGNAGKSGHQDFSFIGSKAFSANATGQLRFAVESGKVMLYGSTDADASAEFAVQVAGATLLSGSDFVF